MKLLHCSVLIFIFTTISARTVYRKSFFNGFDSPYDDEDSAPYDDREPYYVEDSDTEPAGIFREDDFDRMEYLKTLDGDIMELENTAEFLQDRKRSIKKSDSARKKLQTNDDNKYNMDDRYSDQNIKGNTESKPQVTLDKIINVNTEADKDLPEGDIMLTEEQKQHIGLVKRNAIRDRRLLWTTREIPFEIHSSITSDAKNKILSAIDQFHNKTCLRFNPISANATDTTKRLLFFTGNGCWSYIGKTYYSGAQEISIGKGCEHVDIVLHEIMHAVGFFHEQSRPDRNQYVEILWENIFTEMQSNFRRESSNRITTLGLSYDYDGLMHYGEKAFSKNGRVTIKALNNPNQQLGTAKNFSATDLIQIKMLYGCNENGGGWSSWTSYSPCSSACYKARQRVCFEKDIKLCNGTSGSRVQSKVKLCTEEECKRDGHWGRWSSWSMCTATCEYGSHTRQRICNDPAPYNGGQQCSGPNKEKRKCYNGPCNLGPNDCTFELGLCIWNTTSENEVRWRRHRYGTFSKDTGPYGDHSLQGEGYYVYFEASDVKPNATAILFSIQFEPTEKSCLNFWYSMYGTGMGSLTVILEKTNQNTTLKMISGNQGKEWNNTLLEFSASSKHKILFIAERGETLKSDIALDDILIRPGSCQKVTTTQTTTTLPRSSSVTTSEGSTSKTYTNVLRTSIWTTLGTREGGNNSNSNKASIITLTWILTAAYLMVNSA